MTDKKTISALIDRLGGNKLTPCLCCEGGHDWSKELMIGDILGKMPKTGADKLKLVRLWEEHGESISFQQIVDDSGYED